MKFLKKLLMTIMCVLMLSAQGVLVQAQPIDTLGDLNDDGQVDALDYVIIKKYLAGNREIDPAFAERLDANGDGTVDQKDADRIRNIAYYGQVEDLGLEVPGKTIHTANQANFLAAGYSSIGKYAHGGSASNPVTLEYGGDIIASGSKYTIKVSENYDMSEAKTYTSTTRSVKIDNSKVQQLYFWTVNNGSTTSDIQAFYVEDEPLRNLSTGSIGNARDIGGFETEDGFIVKQGMIYRGHMMSPGSDLIKNRNILVNDLGIKTEIDIKEKRSDAIIGSGTTYLPRYMNFMMYGGYLKNSYSSIGNIRKIFDDLANEDAYPVYIHCRIGADRTGLMCFLFNALCGVSKEDCYKDYVFTSFSGDTRTAGWISGDYVKQIENTSGRTFAEKTYNLLVSLKVNPDSLDKFIAIMKEEKPSTKTYVDIPDIKVTTLHYDGEEKSLALPDDYLFTVSGAKATEVGNYAAVLSLKDPITYSWSDGSKSDKVYQWDIDDIREAMAEPDVQIGDLVYTGEEIEIQVAEKEYYTVTGNKATDAGEYELRISLTDKEKYMWPDGSNDDLVYKWNIAKADIDLSAIDFSDTSFVYDGTEKQLVYEGELPKGVSEIIYTDNVLTGDPFKAEDIEATLHLVIDEKNYNQPEDLKAILSIEPIYADLDVSFDFEGLEMMNIVYGAEYELPAVEKEGYVFKGWYVEKDGEYLPIASNGVWEYELTSREIRLVPVFAYETDVETGLEESEDSLRLTVDEEGEGVALLVEAENELDEYDEQQTKLIGLYEMATDGCFELEKQTGRYYYLVQDGKIICRFDQE